MNLRDDLQRIHHTSWSVRIAIIVQFALIVAYIFYWLALIPRDHFFLHADFTGYFTGWSMARDGQSAHLYDLEWQTRYQRPIVGDEPFSDGLLPFVYSPGFVVLFYPLAWLPRPWAFLAWTLIQLGLLWCVLRLLARLSATWEAHERWLLLSTVVAFPPMLLSFGHGAMSLLVLLAMLQFCLGLQAGKQAHAGIWLALLGVVKPQFVLLPSVWLVAARRWRAVSTAAALTGVFVVVSGLLLGFTAWLGLATLLRQTSQFFGLFGFQPAMMYNVRAVLTVLLGSDQATAINLLSTLVLLAGMGVTYVLWRGSWRPADPDFDLRAALTVLLSLLLSPHIYEHDALLLVVPAVLFYRYLRRCGRARQVYVAFLLCNPLLFLVAEFTAGAVMGLRAPLWAMLVLTAWVGAALFQEWQPARGGNVPAIADIPGGHPV